MKAVVMENKKNITVVLADDGTFRTVNGIYPVGTQIDLGDQSLRNQSRGRKFMAPVMAAAAAALVIVCSGYYYSYAAPAGFVSIDVNPSIEYTVNRMYKVTAITPLNEDANGIATRLVDEGLCGQNLSDALNGTMQLLEDENYIGLEESDFVLAGVSSDSEKEKENMVREVSDALSVIPEETGKEVSFYVHEGTKHERKEAKDAGMSPGRYGIYKKHKPKDKKEDFAKKPVKEMIEKEDGLRKVEPPEGGKPTRKPSAKPGGDKKPESLKNS